MNNVFCIMCFGKSLWKNKTENNPCSALPILFPFLFSFLFFISSFTTSAQEVSVSIDTASIKIGEQIQYQISVETDSSSNVTFPEGQTFIPLEMVEAYKIDTSTLDSKLALLKEYTLTKFDSGSYVIPPQRILINDREVLTDSFLVQVGGVVVDTTKQKMYPIKPSLEVPERYHFPEWIWWTLGGLILLGGIGYLLFRRKKKKEEAKRNIPPYEKAMLSLKELDEGPLLEEREIKAYYSVLTDAARRYLDEKVDDRAMESTTSELIARLQLQKDSGRLNIDQQIIDDFEQILNRADLAKFARSRPGVITAKEDRGHIEKIINDTKQGIPEPTEEELQKDEAYRKQYAKKQKRKRMIIWGASGIALLAILITTLVATKGISYVEDVFFGNDTKQLLHGNWITSAYGNPPITITTPEVLVRRKSDSTQNSMAHLTDVETFSSGSLGSDFYAVLSTGRTKKQTGTSDSQNNKEDTQAISAAMFSNLGIENAQNMVTIPHEFDTAEGIPGQKITGSFSIENNENGKTFNKEYVLLSFTKNNGFQQVLLAFDKGDKYAEEIVSRIVYSVELKNPGN